MKMLWILYGIVVGVSVVVAFTPPDAGVAVTAEVSDITFTNGWTISCTSTALVFVAP